MVILVFLGDEDRYLGYRGFTYKHQAELFMDKIQDLMIANIEKKIPLKERLALAPEYFPFAGRIQDVELIELNEQGDKK